MNFQDPAGNAALHHAAEHNAILVAAVLLQAGQYTIEHKSMCTVSAVINVYAVIRFK